MTCIRHHKHWDEVSTKVQNPKWKLLLLFDTIVCNQTNRTGSLIDITQNRERWLNAYKANTLKVKVSARSMLRMFFKPNQSLSLSSNDVKLTPVVNGKFSFIYFSFFQHPARFIFTERMLHIFFHFVNLFIARWSMLVTRLVSHFPPILSVGFDVVTMTSDHPWTIWIRDGKYNPKQKTTINNYFGFFIKNVVHSSINFIHTKTVCNERVEKFIQMF